MSRSIITIFLCLLFFMPYRDAAAILVNLTEEDVEDAIKLGEKQGSNATNYLKRHYRFGEEDVFGEHGTIRTKWGKLMMLSGLLAEKDRKPTEQEKERIMKNTALQIDICTFGNRIDFANAYKVYLVQKDKIIEPERISSDHAAYLPEKKVVTSGFPKYRATVRSYFSYGKISPNEKAEIVLVKNKKKVLFEINFMDYK